MFEKKKLSGDIEQLLGHGVCGGGDYWINHETHRKWQSESEAMP